MTDVSAGAFSLVGRLGVTARFGDGDFVLTLEPFPEIMRGGLVRASVIAFLVDAAAGILVDDDPGSWTLTSDMSVRMRPDAPLGRIEAVSSVLRRGRRSSTCRVELTVAGSGEPVATGAIGFATLARRDTDPPKPPVDPARFVSLFGGVDVIDRPLRDEAGIEAVDPKHGVAQVTVTPQLRNPAGTFQGALVALLAEAAAEDLVSTRFESPAVVTDLDLRYLAQAHTGPVRTRARLLGTTADAVVEVELVDTSVDRVTTLVYARCASGRTVGAHS